MATLDPVYATQYGAHVYRMAQQSYSVLRPFVRVEEMKGEKRSFDRVHPTEVVEIEDKYSTTELVHTVFSRRTVHAKEYGWADQIDWQDDLNILCDPASDVVAMGAAAIGRKLDQIIIQKAFIDPAFEGKDGTTSVALPDSQKIPITWGASENVGLTVAKLLEVRSRFGAADIDVDNPANQICMAVTQKQLDSLYASVDISNKNYSAISDLIDGKSKTLFGINIIKTSLLPGTSVSGGTSRTCAAWVKSGVVCVIPKDLKMKISERDDMWGNWQAMTTFKAGATRLEDAKVLQISCFEK
jgi:hypothetical protein